MEERASDLLEASDLTEQSAESGEASATRMGWSWARGAETLECGSVIQERVVDILGSERYPTRYPSR